MKNSGVELENDAKIHDTDQSGVNLPKKINKPKMKKRHMAIIAAIIFIPLLGWGIATLINYIAWHETTDDAYVQAHANPISSRLTGTVEQVLVDDNQKVKKGQLLVKLDPADYVVKVEQAKAKVESDYWQYKASMRNLPVNETQALGENIDIGGRYDRSKHAVDTALAALDQDRVAIKVNESRLKKAQAKVNKTEADYKRYIPLQKRGVITDQLLDEAKDNYLEAQADYETELQSLEEAKIHYRQSIHNLAMAKSEEVSYHGQVTKARAVDMQTEVIKRQAQSNRAKYDESVAQLHEAQLNLSYTNIVAPADGVVGRKTVEIGQRVQVGEALMAVVESPPWIVANFKEIQLEKMKPGQLVDIEIDLFKHHKFHGYVDSIAPNSGAQFALLPPDNATGNFTKIVQRIPVKIRFNPDSIKGYEDKIVPGLSCVVTVSLKK